MNTVPPMEDSERVSPQDSPASSEEPGHCPVGTDTPQAVGRPGPLGNVAGRFVLFEPTGDEDAYITSWDTWEEAEVVFPIEGKWVFRDDATGREWFAGSPYEWEAAHT